MRIWIGILCSISAISISATDAKSPAKTGYKNSGKSYGSGQASYYSNAFAGKRTASGETYKPSAFTAAHRTAPFGTHIRVTNLNSGQSVVVRINDRGPFHKARVIDMSYAAAKSIGLHRSGTARVKLEQV